MGRVGTVTSRDRHPGSFDVVHVKDSIGHQVMPIYLLPSLTLQFATRLSNTFVIGQGAGHKPLVTLPKGKGVKLTIAEERDRRIEKAKTA
jgi:small subunit ribosomal protein S4e